MVRARVAGALVPRVRGHSVSATAADASARCHELFEGLVGRRTGIVRDLALLERRGDDAPLHFAAARIANAHPHWGDHPGLWTGGCGRTAHDALLAALGEAAERYAASSYPSPAELVPRERLRAGSIPVGALAPFSERQRASAGFPYQSCDDRAAIRWEAGRRLGDGASCWVPAPAVYMLYEPQPGEPALCPGVSTGLACAPSIEEALVHGLCETIERDATALTWVLGVSPPQVPRERLRELAGDLLPPLDRWRAFDLTTDVGVPVMMVVAEGPVPSGDLVSVGAAAHPDPLAALRKAAIEASQTRHYVRGLLENEPGWRCKRGFSNVTDFSHHARLYCGRPALARKAFAFLEGNPRPSPQPDGAAAAREACPACILPTLLETLRHHGLDGAWVDLTPPWGAALCLSVVRVLIPGLFPLHGHQALPYLGHPRLREWRAALPHGVRLHRHSRWPYPHPFP